MIITTTEGVPGRAISRVQGVAMGSTVQSKNIGKDIGAGLKSLVGGELGSYSKLLAEARVEAMTRMEEHAAGLGADAVVNVRITTSTIAGGASEVLAYGTAVTTGPA
ncbi:MAG: YbjQ family protein [Acidimicrobiales bacterium]|jgi:uncharacterized protein YbjQ (UPF0145 family)|nr:hypothetical protein [Acidimicrobiaceae bacterium]MDP6976383.1 YbjQ family protein [Acidimicrobiales bacterium]|tara:strand:- start:171 stop:491 length:321 start_codon:yes stop_codon:yes gene_type:complete